MPEKLKVSDPSRGLSLINESITRHLRAIRGFRPLSGIKSHQLLRILRSVKNGSCTSFRPLSGIKSHQCVSNSDAPYPTLYEFPTPLGD